MMLMMGEEYNSNKPTKSERMTKIVNDFLTEASHENARKKGVAKKPSHVATRQMFVLGLRSNNMLCTNCRLSAEVG